jgi:hypothetical protein
MDAFASDVLIYAAVPGHPLGRRVAALFRSAAGDTHTGSGSVLLLPEILGKPLRDGATEELRPLWTCWPGWTSTPSTDRPPTWLRSCPAGTDSEPPTPPAWPRRSRSGADRFITNSRRDFPITITEVQVTYPQDLPDPAGP